MKPSSIFFVSFLFFITITKAQTTLNFTNLADMPTARGAITSAGDTNYFYVSDGFSLKTKYTGIVEKYNIAKNKWSELTSSLIPKQFASSVIAGNNLYVFNGDLSDGTINNKVEVVDLKNGSISYSTDNPLPARSAGVAVWNGNIYVFGGGITPKADMRKDAEHPSSPAYSNMLYKFDTSSKKWTALASMTEAKETKGEIINGKLYVMGGYSGKVSRRIDVYDIETDKWTSLSPMPQGISANALAVNGSKIFIVFDYTNQTYLGSYDVASGEYAVLQQSNMIARRHGGAHIVNGKLYIMGGNTSNLLNSCLASLQVADLK